MASVFSRATLFTKEGFGAQDLRFFNLCFALRKKLNDRMK